jgi:hypothetical protein
VRPPAVLLVAMLAAFPGGASPEGRVAGTPGIEVAGTLFHARLPDGRILASPELVGAILDVVDETGRSMTVRIDAVVLDPADREGDVWLHRFSVRDRGTGEWRALCATPGPDGSLAGFPLAGSWTADGRHLRGDSFTVTCTAGPSANAYALATSPGAVPLAKPSGIIIRPACAWCEPIMPARASPTPATVP